jgi:hypothetical protein
MEYGTMAYVRIWKTPRADYGGTIHGNPEVIPLLEAIVELCKFTDIKDPDRVKELLGKGEPIYTSVHIYEWKFD